MNRNQNIFVFDKDFASLGQKTAVSLHCHTQHSKEKLNFLPHYIKKTGMFSSFLQRKMEDYAARKKRAIDFDTGYWLPPMSPREVYNSEVQEIREKLGVHAVVSITDHDDVDAGQLLNVIGIHDAPVSTEWTV
ncbi:MAG TPA: hypothetical protein VFG11_06435, partial [Acidobacteriota bacterium]|nr:hypothetical protein [Acidobacteriota bacterium]